MARSLEWPLACSSYSFSNDDLSSVLKRIKKMGFSRVDLGWPQIDVRKDGLEPTRKALDETKIHPCVLSLDLLDLPSDNPRHWHRKGTLLLRRSLEAASQLQVKKIGLVVRYSHRPSFPQRVLLRVIQTLRNVVPDCRYFQIPVCLEIHPRGPITDLVDALIVKEEVASPWIGYTLDTSLLTWLSINPGKAVRTLKDCPLNVHLREVTDHDFFGIPGRGNINFENFFRALKEINYRDACIIELFKTQENFGISLEEGICEAKHYLEGILKEIDWSYTVNTQ